MLAPADLVSSELAPYLVAPLFAGILVFCAFALARQVAGFWAGLLAAALLAVSPIVMMFATAPMSDVPAAACLAVALVMSLSASRWSAAAAGAAVAAAVMIRPVTAPLLLIPALLVITGGTPNVLAWRAWNWRRALAFALVAAVGPLILLWSQRVLYGGYFTPGYVGFSGFFRLENVAQNLAIYPRYLASVHTPLIFAGLASVIFRANSRVVVALFAVALLDYAVYLPYMTYDAINSLRFMLPAVVALMILLGVLSVHLARAVAIRVRWLAPLVLAPAFFVAADSVAFMRYALSQRVNQARVQLMGRYLREVLPWNAVVITHLQGGAVSHYTGRPIVRFDLLEREQLEPIVTGLVRRGHRPMFLIDEKMEAAPFKDRFAGTAYERLAWRPRALFADANSTIWLLDVADRDRPARQPATDVIR